MKTLKEKHITQTSLAKQMGISVQYLNQAITGRRKWTDELLDKSFDILGKELKIKAVRKNLR